MREKPHEYCSNRNIFGKRLCKKLRVATKGPENGIGTVRIALTETSVSLSTDRHPAIPSMRARRLQRPNRVEGPFVLAGKQKVSEGYSPADENAGLVYALRDDDL
jgi:hypothetical protein